MANTQETTTATATATTANDDNSWVFDSLICFLNGPIWNAPLQSFIEEKSLIFEPSDKDDDEYRKIHDEFKNLVDLMLGSYMEDIGITPEQFEIACSNGMHQNLPSRFQENLFEQIWAANDFEMFKRMMIQKNIELQLQALELIEQKYGITPQLFIPETSSTPFLNTVEPVGPVGKSTPLDIPSTSSEKQVFVEVIKQCETNDNDDTIEIDTEDKSFIDIEEEKHKLENVLHATDKTEQYESYTKAALGAQKVDDAEMKKRQEYLKAQRDKLVALKKQVRKKHLEIEILNGNTNKKMRPQSARTAEQMLNNSGDHVKSDESEIETLKIRKALAQRLRTEVIGKNDTN